MEKVDTRRIYSLFSVLLDYPGTSMLASVDECVERLKDCCPEAAQDLHDFHAYAEREGLETMEEVYTRTFDITPTVNLYVGYHLFGESFKRGAFLARLQEEYQAHGFVPGPELADHLSVALRFASVVDDPDFVDPLIDEGILPTLDKVADALKETAGYGLVIRALRSFVKQNCQQLVAAGGL